MAVNIVSTTDSPEAVSAAIGDLAKEKVAAEAKSETAPKESVETPDESDPSKVAGEENPVDEDADEDHDDEDPEESQAKDGQKPKKKKGFKKRIDKLNRRLSDKEREVDYWRQEAQKAKAPAEATKVAPKASESSAKPKVDDFDSHDAYVEALTDWKIEQREKAADIKKREADVVKDYQSKVGAHREKVKSFVEDHDDFNDLIESVEDIPMPMAVQEAILDSENGPELMYELAKNKKEYARICALPALAAAREIGKFETKFVKSSEGKPVIKQSKAPAPISPVGAKGSAVKKSISDPNLSQREYERLRDEQEAKRA